MTFTNIVATDPLIAAKAMQNWRHVNYGQDLLPVNSLGNGIDYSINLGSTSFRWATIYGVSQILRDGEFELLKDDSGTDRGIKLTWSLGDDAGIIDTPNPSTSLQFRINNVMKMTLDASTGFLGIGLINPATKLHMLNGTYTQEINSDSTHGIILENSNQNKKWSLLQLNSGATPSNGFLIQHFDGVSSSGYFYIDENGNVGINHSSPDFKLDITGDIRIQESNKLYFGGTGAADNDVNLFRFAANQLKTDDDLVVGGDLRTNSDLLVDGNTGLGQSTPTSICHLFDSNPILNIEDSNLTGGNSQFIKFITSNGVHSQIEAHLTLAGIGYLAFYTSNALGTPLERFRLTQDGKLSTNAESGPDCDVGGLCLNKQTTTGKALTFKQSGVAHGIISLLETDTYAAIKEVTPAGGGCQLIGATSGTIGLQTVIAGTTTDTTETISSNGVIKLDGGKKSGTAVVSLTADENILVISTNASTKHIFKGNGDIYTDTGVIDSYDQEDDIILAETIRNIWDGKKTINEYKNRLEELGILKNGFMSHQKMHSLNLGCVGQLYNIVKNLAKKFDISENELLEMSKNYA